MLVHALSLSFTLNPYNRVLSDVPKTGAQFVCIVMAELCCFAYNLSLKPSPNAGSMAYLRSVPPALHFTEDYIHDVHSLIA